MTCEFCTQGYILPGEPSGIMIDGDYYRAAPSGSSKSFAVVVLTDIFGLPLKNPQLIADELSQRLGCDAWVPDVFDGQHCWSPHVRCEPYICLSRTTSI